MLTPPYSRDLSARTSVRPDVCLNPHLPFHTHAHIYKHNKTPAQHALSKFVIVMIMACTVSGEIVLQTKVLRLMHSAKVRIICESLTAEVLFSSND